jgi:hypothetical protein
LTLNLRITYLHLSQVRSSMHAPPLVKWSEERISIIWDIMYGQLCTKEKRFSQGDVIPIFKYIGNLVYIMSK